ncbi:hypothetical protein ACFPRL_27890 [Pseudoclavibacter helvolus]
MGLREESGEGLRGRLTRFPEEEEVVVLAPLRGDTHQDLDASALEIDPEGPRTRCGSSVWLSANGSERAHGRG